jgi:hypothetical protein
LSSRAELTNPIVLRDCHLPMWLELHLWINQEVGRYQEVKTTVSAWRSSAYL